MAHEQLCTCSLGLDEQGHRRPSRHLRSKLEKKTPDSCTRTAVVPAVSAAVKTLREDVQDEDWQRAALSFRWQGTDSLARWVMPHYVTGQVTLRSE